MAKSSVNYKFVREYEDIEPLYFLNEAQARLFFRAMKKIKRGIDIIYHRCQQGIKYYDFHVRIPRMKSWLDVQEAQDSSLIIIIKGDGTLTEEEAEALTRVIEYNTPTNLPFSCDLLQAFSIEYVSSNLIMLTGADWSSA